MKDWVDYYEKCTGITIRPYIEEIAYATPATFCRYLNGNIQGRKTIKDAEEDR
ncbi:MAG: hypothetical protein ACI4ET_03045 [Bilifractor sp.]